MSYIIIDGAYWSVATTVS